MPAPAHVAAAAQQANPGAAPGASNLTRHLCNIQKTTGTPPPGLVGASTTIVGDKLYVFGGRRPLRAPPVLSQRVYELDLIHRHWTRLSVTGDVPSPRYFHSMCGLGDTKLVCYGGMAFMSLSQVQTSPTKDKAPAADPPIIVMSDIHLFDIPTNTWTAIDAANAPQGRYAHCATVLPSTAVWTSTNAHRSALHHNPSSNSNPNHGSVGIDIDGTGGAEMVVVGGQDAASGYLDQICVFNLRSLRWTSTTPLSRSCGAYRSVIAPLTGLDGRKIGTFKRDSALDPSEDDEDPDGSSTLIYSNYNFLNVELSLQVRLPDGTCMERSMQGPASPPGLRFPTGGVINDKFVVSGTYMTSTKQEYSLWTLDLRTLTWSRLEFGGGSFAAGSWNKGLTWNRRSAFVILGDRRRNLAEDYQLRRINFHNVCVVELEAFGMYENPRSTSRTSSYISRSSSGLPAKQDAAAGGRSIFHGAQDLGLSVLAHPQLADMDLLAIGGERVPVNSHVISRRWGPYFAQLLREGSGLSSPTLEPNGGDAQTLRPAGPGTRTSSVTITGASSNSNHADGHAGHPQRTSLSPTLHRQSQQISIPNRRQTLDLTTTSDPSLRPRQLYLPHTLPTVQALVYYLYTSTLPPLCLDAPPAASAPTSPSSSAQTSTPQILCSLLQIARPYRVDGLLEAVVEKLHLIPDGRHTPAVFNAAAMAAGGGSGIAFAGDSATPLSSPIDPATGLRRGSGVHPLHRGGRGGLGAEESGSESEGYSTESSAGDETPTREVEVDDEEVWSGELSAVVGLQLRGLRGLMEGRRMRDREGVGLGVSGAE